ncbi:hypothetical protein HYALB_00013290 [Hymenoscyphus albidus]|uniref:Uncharacterized protein n=1 Tax=Hymenoscyphus albidus TaxID=595503 RepID=A0A9N9PYI6_9HELO|nr:hypothetical protein HYALB_00013290 [Hymenoscyphus albidus]
MFGGGLPSKGGIMGLVSLILIAGSIVLMFFVILSGVTGTTPLDKTYFLEADTTRIDGPRPISQWTYFYICGPGNTDCGSPVPALPIGYAWNGGNQGAPFELVGDYGKGTTSKYFWYMWRFGWVFYLMGLIFNVISFFTCLLAPFSRLASGVSGFFVANALFWFTIAASLMTTVFVKARDVLINNGHPARVGRWAFGFTWGAWAAMFLATIFLFLGCGAGGSSSRSVPTTRGGIFTRSKHGSRRSRGSFIDTDGTRRVKDDYA